MLPHRAEFISLLAIGTICRACARVRPLASSLQGFIRACDFSNGLIEPNIGFRRRIPVKFTNILLQFERLLHHEPHAFTFRVRNLHAIQPTAFQYWKCRTVIDLEGGHRPTLR